MPYFNPVKVPLAAIGLFLLAFSAPAAPVLPSPDDPQALNSWFSSLGPRREGSATEAQIFEALRIWFPSGPGVEESGFQDMEGEHSFSRQLWFRVQGKAPGELVVVTPTDGINHRGLAWAVAWAKATVDRRPEVSLIFLFTGAERGSGKSAGLGSRAFLQDFYPTDPAAVLYFDTNDLDSRLELTTESGLFPSPLWMVQGLNDAFERQSLTPKFTGTAPSLFRLDLPEHKNALAPWFDRSIPALLVADGPPSRAVVRAFEDFVLSMDKGMPSHWDRHYLVFDLGFWKFFWDQGTYITVFLLVAGLLLFGYALAGRSRRGSLKILGTGFWQIPVLFAFLFLALAAGTELAEVLQVARSQPEFWKTSPLLVWTFKGSVAVALYLALFLPFRRSPLSRDPDFYSQAALAWLGLMVLVAAGFELSFSFYFLWALVWCAVLVAVSWQPLRFLALAAGPLWLVKAAWDVLGPQPDLSLSQWVLVSPLAGNFALSVLLFPFLLQVNAWHFSGKIHQDRDEGLRAAVQLGLFSLVTLFLGLAVLRSPPLSPLPQEDLPGQISLVENPRPELWSTKVTRSAFLDRTVWTLRFSGDRDPEEVDLFLNSEGPLTIFDCTFPVTLDAAGNKARIIIGRQPALPLVLGLTLPAKTQARLEVRVFFSGPPGVAGLDSVELRP